MKISIFLEKIFTLRKNGNLPEDTQVTNVQCEADFDNVKCVVARSKKFNEIYKWDEYGNGFISTGKSWGVYIDDDNEDENELITAMVINFEMKIDICFTSKNLKQND